MAHHDERFPNETPEYRAARDRLLDGELELRRKVAAVAALRRELPLGGLIPQDYAFDERDRATGATRKTKLSELFGEKDTLVVYSMMYGPKMKAACPSCTAIVDALDAQTVHIEQRTALVVVARNPIDVIQAHAESRGWRRIRLLSSSANDYNRDYHAESADGDQLPAVNVFARRPDGIHHFWSAELLYADIPGEDPRHADTFWPLWNVLDLTPEGRGTDWYPKL